MNHPVISIIVPIYNAEKDLPRCLDSLVNQTFTDIEIVCVIDGSPDNSLGICEEYREKDSRIIVVSQKNMGLSGARNTGLANASGEYIQFCDPDDFFEPEMCKTMYAVISSSQADLAVAGIQVFYDHVAVVPGDERYYRIKNEGLCSINEVIIRNTDNSACNKMFKKSIIDKYGIRFPQGLIYEDVCFFCKYILVSETIYGIPEYLYNYIRHDNSIMSNTFKGKTQKAIDHVRILEDIKTFMKKNNLCGKYEIDIFLWLLIRYMNLAVKHGVESVYDSVLEMVSNLLSDISDDSIQSSPYIAPNVKTKLFLLKKKDRASFFHLAVLDQRKQKIKSIISPFFPEGSRRRNLLLKIYKKMAK